MNPHVRVEYLRLRLKGWTASSAMRAARIRDAFEDLENEGLVKLVPEDDGEAFDASFVDTWTDMSEARRARQKKIFLDRADRDGVTCLVAYVLTDGEWESVDSCGGFVGDDWKDSGYDVDAMLSAIRHIGRCGDVNLPCLGKKKSECVEPLCVVEGVLES